jgi:hypothetical protein
MDPVRTLDGEPRIELRFAGLGFDQGQIGERQRHLAELARRRGIIALFDLRVGNAEAHHTLVARAQGRRGVVGENAAAGDEVEKIGGVMSG